MFLRKNKQNIEALISSKHYLTNLLFFAFKIVLNLKKQFSSSIFSFEIILDFKKRFSLHLVPPAIGKINQLAKPLMDYSKMLKRLCWVNIAVVSKARPKLSVICPTEAH